MTRFVADVGNSRLKWARRTPDGNLVDPQAGHLDDPDFHDSLLQAVNFYSGPVDWAIATVNPPMADRLCLLLRDQNSESRMTWYRSAADVPIGNRLLHPERTGADRALAVWRARQMQRGACPTLVVLCGTAITIERISSDGVWQGGVIAPGLGLSARALHQLTAQLPLLALTDEPPASWGASTEPAMAAGLFWGTVGAIRELLARQAYDLDGPPSLIWSGGDAPVLARHVEGAVARVEPNLVLEALARLAFGAEPPP